jgi:hypothetical protein
MGEIPPKELISCVNIMAIFADDDGKKWPTAVK